MRRRGDLAEIQVFDTGIGIPADKLNTVFQEFTRLDDGAREAQGLGLGLSIVDRIARVLRLELRIDSQRGQGHALFRDPAGDAGGRADPTRSRGQGRASGSQPRSTGCRCCASTTTPRILDGMRLLLEGWGCDVDTASGSAGTSRRPALRRPDIILADYHLDGETGLDVDPQAARRYGARRCRPC